MDPLKAAKPLMLLSATTALLLAPSARGELQPVGSGEACANGTCCSQSSAICEHAGHDHHAYYYLATGQCDKEEEPLVEG